MHELIDYDKLGNDPVEQFAREYFKDGKMVVPLAIPALIPTDADGGITALRIFRQPPFQVELIIVQPNTIIPEHGHPNIDSIEVYLGGRMRFSLNGKYLETEEKARSVDENGFAGMRGMWVRVRPNQAHGGVFTEDGGAFLSIQHWINGKPPTHVGYDWEGIAASETQGKKVHSGMVYDYDGELKASHAAPEDEE